ncbi:MAG TPA: hypothetical protein VK184_25615 [Nostocaceae cyanobacterium]|nr:hypothetical protein [Nostocaceae cyanobacterium]
MKLIANHPNIAWGIFLPHLNDDQLELVAQLPSDRCWDAPL